MSPHAAAAGTVLILAPAGRDARLAASVLEQADIRARVCKDIEALVSDPPEGPAALLLTEHALTPGLRDQLKTWLARQPLWSDLPVVVLTGHPAGSDKKRLLAAILAELGNVTVIDRPMHREVLVSTVRAALRARERQPQARELLERLEEAIRERDRFLAMLSHELRNPLGAVRNATEVLCRQSLPPQVARPVAIVDRQAKHLGRLVDDLLDVARVTSGKIALQKARCELGDVVERAARQLERAIEQGQLRLQVKRSSRPVVVEADPVRIEQVVSNLLTNAVKYTPPGGTLEVTVEAKGGDAVIRVADSGVGIAPEMLSSVFKMFVQADRSLDRSQGGMGIGLTLVRLLIELHGGKVEAASAGLGKGSTFTVTLPLLAGADATTPEPAVNRTVAARRHVLLVEDNVDNREMLQALLEMDGHQVETAADGLQAVQRGLDLKPDVAIIDIGLPGIDGYEVAQRLRAELGDRVVLVALTGYGMPEDRQKAARAGFNVHLIKPVGLPELEAALQR